MRIPMRTAVLAGVLAAACAVPAMAQEAVGEPEPDLAATGATDGDRRLKILELKLRVEEAKAKVAGDLGRAKTDEEKAAYKEVLKSLDQMFAILEDMLQNG